MTTAWSRNGQKSILPQCQEGKGGEELGGCVWVRGESSFESWELGAPYGLRKFWMGVDLLSLSFLVRSVEEGDPLLGWELKNRLI